jgi:hypothetical protein
VWEVVWYGGKAGSATRTKSSSVWNSTPPGRPGFAALCLNAKSQSRCTGSGTDAIGGVSIGGVGGGIGSIGLGDGMGQLRKRSISRSGWSRSSSER